MIFLLIVERGREEERRKHWFVVPLCIHWFKTTTVLERCSTEHPARVGKNDLTGELHLDWKKLSNGVTILWGFWGQWHNELCVPSRYFGSYAYGTVMRYWVLFHNTWVGGSCTYLRWISSPCMYLALLCGLLQGLPINAWHCPSACGFLACIFLSEYYAKCGLI